MAIVLALHGVTQVMFANEGGIGEGSACRGFSLHSHRELLLRDADSLEDEADRLDIEHPDLWSESVAH